MDLELKLVTDVDGFRALKERWEDIVRASSRATYFASWEWLFSWWEIYHTAQMRLRIFCVYRNDLLIAILPLYTGRSRKFNLVGFSWLRFLGTGEDETEEVSTEYSDIICLDEYEDEVVEFLRGCLARGEVRWDKFVLERVLSSSLVARLLQDITQGFRWRRTLAGLRYLVDIGHGIEEYRDTLDPSFRRKIDYFFRKIERDGEFRFSLTTDRDSIAADLESLAELHSRRWQKKGQHGAFTAEKFLRFHELQMNHLLDQDGLFLLKLSHRDEVTAMFYAIGYKRCFHYYQSGFDPDRYKSISPGHLMIFKSIEIAIAKRYAYFDFMLGSPHSYKRDYRCQTDEMYNLKVYNQRSRSRFLRRISTLAARFAELGRARQTESSAPP